MKILVLGGNGFIGSNIVNYLASNNHEVYSFDRNLPSKEKNNIHYIRGDFFSIKDLSDALKNMDVVIHTISTINPSNSASEFLRGYEKDFIQTISLFKLASDNSIRLLFISSGGTVYGKKNFPIQEDSVLHPLNHYGALKVCVETVMHTFNLQAKSDFISIRISNPYGPGQDFEKGVGFIDAVLKKSIMGEIIEIWGDGEVIRDYIYITDVCKIIEKLLYYKGEHDTFNISTGIGSTQNDIIEYIKDLGLHPKIIYKESRGIDVKKNILDNSRIKTLYKDKLISLSEGIRMYYDFLKRENIK